MNRLSKLLLTVVALLSLSLPAVAQEEGSTPPTTQGDGANTDETTTTTEEPVDPAKIIELEAARERKKDLTRERSNLSRELGAAKIESKELAESLAALDSEVARQASLLETTRLQLGRALTQAKEATEALSKTQAEQSELEVEVTKLAVNGFLDAPSRNSAIFEVGSVNDVVRQDRLLKESNAAPAELLEQLKALEEDHRLAKEALDSANAEKLALEASLKKSIEELNEQQAEQSILQSEMNRRIAAWEAQVASLNDAVAEVTKFLQEEDPDADPDAPPPAPGDPSVAGFQWPYIGRVGSGYGYRIHPIYRTRRLHTGLDIGGTTNDPIYAANDGEVIWVARRGGYGLTVMIDHGEGVVTLYAHMVAYEVSEGDDVFRGDVIGYIGSTGTSTSPHLHFEVRVNGNPVDPMPYLP